MRNTHTQTYIKKHEYGEYEHRGAALFREREETRRGGGVGGGDRVVYIRYGYRATRHVCGVCVWHGMTFRKMSPLVTVV